MTDLPYFDLLLEAPDDPAARVFRRFVHWGYWEDPSAATLDRAEFAAAMERLNAEVVAAAGIEAGQSVLDAGCGFGGTAAGLLAAGRGLSVTGLNIDPRQLVLARENAPGARFVEGDACAMPFPDEAFDRVLAVECIFHFPSRLRFLKEAARVLKPGGRVSLSDFVPLSTRGHGGPIGRRLEAEVAAGYGFCGDGWKDGGYSDLARAAGLRLALDRDITANTLPTYPVLLDLIENRAMGGPEGRMTRPTKVLKWLSILRLVRYRIVAFEKA